MVATPRGACWPGAIATLMPAILAKRWARLSTTADDNAGTVLAPEIRHTPAASALAAIAAGKPATKSRPSAISM
ncbi:hypothetical protein D3C80_1826420 [compost metagenome]